MTSRRFDEFAPMQRFQPALAISPDGRQVVFSSNASGQSNLWRQEIGGTVATQLTRFTDRAVRDVAWSPDGAKLVFTADHDGDEFHQLFVIDANGGEPRRLTDAPQVQHQLATIEPFSRDGRRVLYAGNDRDRTSQDVLLLDLETGDVQRIVATEGLHFPIGFSPDERYVGVTRLNSNTDADLLLVEPGVTDPAQPRLLNPHEGDVKHDPAPWKPDGTAVYAITDSGRDFTGIAEFPVAEGAFRWVESPEWDVEQAVVSADGSTLAWTVNEDGYSRVRARDLRSGDGISVPSVPGGTISALRISPDGHLLAFLLARAAQPTEVVAVDIATGAVHVLTDSTPPALHEITAVEPQLVRFRTHDGRDVPAFLYRPHGDGPFPVLLSIHGGPEAQERPSYMYGGFYQYLLAQGIGVLAPNVRGSTGYGSAYQKLIHHDWGGDELRDFEHAVKYLHTLSWVDPTRIAVFGGSFGGFATLSCVSRLPKLWAAGVSIVGPSNLVTFVKAVPPTWLRLMAKWVGDAETERDFLLERSPVTYADDIVAPLFVIQGANDPRVVKSESDQIVERLRARGVDVRYDVYEDEGHGFTKRANEIKALGDAAEFLVSHLRA
ncbi:MAG TPA: S9 family peptidase [Acidothermaceae bacterium]|nr:S9 family peptidase [Acidothermaceae bacterium]